MRENKEGSGDCYEMGKQNIDLEQSLVISLWRYSAKAKQKLA